MSITGVHPKVSFINLGSGYTPAVYGKGWFSDFYLAFECTCQSNSFIILLIYYLNLFIFWFVGKHVKIIRTKTSSTVELHAQCVICHIWLICHQLSCNIASVLRSWILLTTAEKVFIMEHYFPSYSNGPSWDKSQSLSGHGIIGPYFIEGEDEHPVTVNREYYRQNILNFFVRDLKNLYNSSCGSVDVRF